MERQYDGGYQIFVSEPEVSDVLPIPALVVGRIVIDRDGTVTDVKVDKNHRRGGIGTQLYERAARISCSLLHKPLQSDTTRTAYAQAFWEKQVKKQRAACVQRCTTQKCSRDSRAIVGRGGCLRYRLTCPAPKTLRGVK